MSKCGRVGGHTRKYLEVHPDLPKDTCASQARISTLATRLACQVTTHCCSVQRPVYTHAVARMQSQADAYTRKRLHKHMESCEMAGMQYAYVETCRSSCTKEKATSSSPLLMDSTDWQSYSQAPKAGSHSSLPNPCLR